MPAPEILMLQQDVDFVENKNANGTGGVHIGSAETVEFQGVLFFRNSGFDGGAVTIDAPDVKVDFRNCLFEWNSAANVGGALNQNSSAFLTITRSIFRHNEAVEAAAGIHIKVLLQNQSLALQRIPILNLQMTLSMVYRQSERTSDRLWFD